MIAQQAHDVAWVLSNYGWNFVWTAIICAALIGR